MFNASARACLLVLGAALAISASGQPPDAKKEEPKIKGVRPDYTAFPDIKPPTVEKKEIKLPNGNVEFVFEEKGVVPLPPLPVLAADASPLRKLQFEQLQEGFAYLEAFRVISCITPASPQGFRDYHDMTAEVYRLAAELEEQPAKRVP